MQNERGKNMSFEKINEQDHKVIHERSCMILYYFTTQEIKQIQNAARLSGIKDFAMVSSMQADTKIQAILDGELAEGNEGYKEKAIIFNHIPSTRMNAFIEALKKCRIRRPLMAVVTETSIHWSMNELIANLIEERRAVSRGEFTSHE